MAMYKAAQSSTEGDELVVALPTMMEPEGDDDTVVFYDEEPTPEEVLELHSPEVQEISFKLPFLPGCSDEMMEVSTDDEDDAKDSNKEDKEKSKASEQPKDLAWIKQFLDNIPSHKGETLGIERAKSYLGRGLTMLSKMLQDDHEGKIDISKAEDARIEMENGHERLDKELTKRKKKASTKSGDLTKSAQKIPAVGGIIVTVPLKISRIARVCINAAVSSGKDISNMVAKQSDKWKLSDDEQEDVIQLIQDMGYFVRRDRSLKIDDKDMGSTSANEGSEWASNYQS